MCDSGSAERDSDQKLQRNNQSSSMYFCCTLSNDSVVDSHDSIEENNEAQNEDENDKEVEMTSTEIKNKLFLQILLHLLVLQIELQYVS